jgi:hypothetical protein
MNCLKCQKKIDDYGTNFIELKLMKNYQSQGYPDEYPVATIRLCLDCLGDDIKNFINEKVVNERN